VFGRCIFHGHTKQRCSVLFTHLQTLLDAGIIRETLLGTLSVPSRMLELYLAAQRGVVSLTDLDMLREGVYVPAGSIIKATYGPVSGSTQNNNDVTAKVRAQAAAQRHSSHLPAIFAFVRTRFFTYHLLTQQVRALQGPNEGAIRLASGIHEKIGDPYPNVLKVLTIEYAQCRLPVAGQPAVSL
jgi:hypothetical protein